MTKQNQRDIHADSLRGDAAMVKATAAVTRNRRFDNDAAHGQPTSTRRLPLESAMRNGLFLVFVLLQACAAAQAQVPSEPFEAIEREVPTAEAPAPSSAPGTAAPPAEEKPADKAADTTAETTDKPESEPIPLHDDDGGGGDNNDDETAGIDTDDDASDDANGDGGGDTDADEPGAQRRKSGTGSAKPAKR
ncbi:MAG: hypothetical protein EXR77_14690 [Myxococcales bacterium]|nr:hypothetical protein [Myxococcales bacterium]